MISTESKVLLLGAGGHARVVLSALTRKGISVYGYVTPDDDSMSLPSLHRRGNDESVFLYPPNAVWLVNGLGSVRETVLRTHLFEKFYKLGYRFMSVIDPSALVLDDIELGEGIQIMAGAIIQPGCRLGKNCIVNTRAVIEHDCDLGNHSHVASGAVLSGGVQVGDGSHIGVGAVIRQGIRIGCNVTIGAGAVVISDIPDHATFVGVPARQLKKKA